MNMFLRIASAMTLAAYLPACTSLHRVDVPPERVAAEAKVGDTVRLFQREGPPRELTIVSITADRICGEDQCVARDAITGMERREFSGWKTAALVGGIVLLLGLAGGMTPPMAGGPSVKTSGRR